MKDKLGAGRSKVRDRLPAMKIPPWFRLGNYRGARDLDSFGWWQQISVRRTCFGYLREKKGIGTAIPDEWHERIGQALASLRKQPICDKFSTPFDGHPFDSAFDFVQVNKGPLSAVWTMTLRDLYRVKRVAEERLAPDQIRETQNYESAFCLRPRFWGTSPVVPAADSLFIWQEFPLMIDLRHPNSVLVEHFGAHLRLLRKRTNGRPKEAAQHAPDLAEWARQGLLPCMDLILWTEEQGRKIPDSLLVEAVNPGPDDEVSDLDEVEDDTVRKTIRPLAKELLDWQSFPDTTLGRLRSLVSLIMTQKYGLEHGNRGKRVARSKPPRPKMRS